VIAGGVFLGVALSVALSQALKSFLYGVQPSDPATLIGVGLLFVAVGLLACWVPAWRAEKVDPLEALRYD
jgi:putative ABC transport system permease protein